MTGAIERGEAEAIVERQAIPNLPGFLAAKLRSIATDADTIANSDDPSRYVDTLADMGRDLREAAKVADARDAVTAAVVALDARLNALRETARQVVGALDGAEGLPALEARTALRAALLNDDSQGSDNGAAFARFAIMRAIAEFETATRKDEVEGGAVPIGRYARAYKALLQTLGLPS